MGKVIAFANQKGGVGKSTLTVQAAFYLRKHRKKKVLVIDIDSQGNTIRIFDTRTAVHRYFSLRLFLNRISKSSESLMTPRTA